MPWYLAPTSFLPEPHGDLFPPSVAGKRQPHLRLYSTFDDLEEVECSNREPGDCAALTLVYAAIPRSDWPWTEIDKVPADKLTVISTDFDVNNLRSCAHLRAFDSSE